MDTHGVYLLDTCTCIAMIKGVPSVVEKIRQVGLCNCKISEITVAELLFGAFKSGHQKHFQDVDVIKSLFEQYPISNCLQEYAEMRWQLERIGKRIDHFDLLIAATALHEDLIVVTGNIDHFNRIPDLKTENWMI